MLCLTHRQWHTLVLAGCLLLAGCRQQPAPEPTGETLIARIGDRTLSENEVLRRAEYTIRPDYCNGDNYIHQKIVLNSLIAEKLFALEAEKNPALVQNEEFQDYLIGRKEQAMRQWLYHAEAHSQVVVDTAEIKRVHKLAGRTYQVAYFTLEDSLSAARAATMLRRPGSSFDAVFQHISGSLEPPQREVAFQQVEHEAVLDSLYTVERAKNQVVGPISGEGREQTFIKILGWTDRKLLSDRDIQRRWEDSKDWLQEKKAGERYQAYLAKLMRGKRVEFNPATFRALVLSVGPHYLRSRQEKKDAFNATFWGEQENEVLLQDLGRQIDELQQQPLFRVDGQVWTVADFERELRRHPLVFRKRQMTKDEFAEQFKLAIVDMIRDRYVTDDAYKKGYDREPVVQRNYEMWRDNLYALYHLNAYLKNLGKLSAYRADAIEVIETELNAYVDSLQAKYHDQIEVNTDRYDQLKLTRIDMMVMQRNVPFPIVVPAFPVITTDYRFDYGRKLEPEPGRTGQ